MKAVKKRLSAIVLGVAIALAGCGGGQTGEVLVAWSVETDSSGIEDHGESGQSQSSQGQNTLTLGAYETPWELTFMIFWSFAGKRAAAGQWPLRKAWHQELIWLSGVEFQI